MKLQKGGKQSLLSYNISEKYNGVGNVLNGHTKTMRIPVNQRIREAYYSVKIHALAISAHLPIEALENFDFGECIFGSGILSTENMMWVRMMAQANIDYVYRHNDSIQLKGHLQVLDGATSISLDTGKIKQNYEYEYWMQMEDAVEELFSAISEWDDNKVTVTKDQLAMDFLAIDGDLSLEDAKDMFDKLDPGAKDEIVSKHLLKWTEATEDMKGVEKQEEGDVKEKEENEVIEDFETIGTTSKEEEAEEEERQTQIELEQAEEARAKEEVAKQLSRKKVEKKSEPTAKVMSAAEKAVAKKKAAKEAVAQEEVGEDPFRNESNVVPKMAAVG